MPAPPPSRVGPGAALSLAQSEGCWELHGWAALISTLRREEAECEPATQKDYRRVQNNCTARNGTEVLPAPIFGNFLLPISGHFSV